LGSYENLKNLEFSPGSSLESIGEMPKLSSLSLYELGDSCLFPLEQVISFKLMCDEGKFEQIQDRFLILEDLHLSFGRSFSLSSHVSALKKLKSLSLTDYRVANLSGLENLSSLEVLRVPTILGNKEEIFTKLRKLYGDDYLVNEWFLNLPQLVDLEVNDCSENLAVDHLNPLLQFPSVHIDGDNNCEQFRDSDLLLGERVKALEIRGVQFRSFTDVRPRRCFDEIVLSSNDFLKDFSMFSNVQKMYLWACKSVTDISPLRNIPYLVIGRCHRIQDYSCLGSQHYLEIGRSDSLLDEHLRHFGKVHCLKITNCVRITNIDCLTNNHWYS
jgi:hypothetical protein